MADKNRPLLVKRIIHLFLGAALATTVAGCASFNPGYSHKTPTGDAHMSSLAESKRIEVALSELRSKEQGTAASIVEGACSEDYNRELCAKMVVLFSQTFDHAVPISPFASKLMKQGRELITASVDHYGCRAVETEIECIPLADKAELAKAAETPAQEKVHLTRGKFVKVTTLDKRVAGIIMAEEGTYQKPETVQTPYIHDASNASGDVATDATGRFTVKLPDQGPSLWKQIVDTNKAELAQLSKGLSGAMDSIMGAAGNVKTWAIEQTSALSGAVDGLTSSAVQDTAPATQNLTEKANTATSSFVEKAKDFGSQVASSIPLMTLFAAAALSIVGIIATAADALFDKKAKSPFAQQSIKQTARKAPRKRQAIKKSSAVVTAFDAVAAALFGKKAESPFALDSIKQTVRRTPRNRPAMAARKPTRATTRLNVNVVLYRAFSTFGLCAA